MERKEADRERKSVKNGKRRRASVVGNTPAVEGNATRMNRKGE